MVALLAFIAKYGVPTNQWTWLLEVLMTTIALWVCVCADDWAAESAIKASNQVFSNVLIEFDEFIEFI